MKYQNQLLNRINLKLLHSFALVAEHRGFREAAVQAGRSQSAISMQIKQLEQQLDTTLIVRTTRSFELTPEGELLLDQVRRAIQEITYGLSCIADRVASRRTEVKIACSSAFAATRMPSIIKNFEQDYPDVHIELMEHKSAELLEAVKQGRADFGIGPLLTDDAVEFQLVEVEPLLAIIPKEWTEGDKNEIDFHELAKMPLVCFQGNTVLGRLMHQAARDLGVQLQIKYQCIQGHTLVALAESGLGACITTESISDLAHLTRTRKMVIKNPALSRHFALLKMRGRILTPGAQKLYDLISRYDAVDRMAR